MKKFKTETHSDLTEEEITLLENMTEGLERLDQELQQRGITLEQYVDEFKQKKEQTKWVELKKSKKRKVQ